MSRAFTVLPQESTVTLPLGVYAQSLHIPNSHSLPSLFLLPTSKKIKTGKLFTSSSRFFISQKHKHAIKWLHVCIKQTAVSSQGALAETTRGRLEMISLPQPTRTKHHCKSLTGLPGVSDGLQPHTLFNVICLSEENTPFMPVCFTMSLFIT